MRSPMGTDENYGAEGKVRRGNGIRPFLPLMGFLLIVSFGAMSYVLGPMLYQQFGASLGLPADVGPIFFGVVIFVILLFVSFMLYAMFAPKKPKAARGLKVGVTERDLANERKAIEAERAARKKMKRKVNADMARTRTQQAKGKK